MTLSRRLSGLALGAAATWVESRAAGGDAGNDKGAAQAPFDPDPSCLCGASSS